MGELNYVFIAAGGARIAECFYGAVFKMAAHRPVFHGTHTASGAFADNRIFQRSRLFFGRTCTSANQADH